MKSDWGAAEACASAPARAFYAALAASGKKPDARQPLTAAAFARLLDRIAAAPPRSRLRRPSLLFPPPPPARGLYCWGAPGRGKTMLMDAALGALAREAPVKVARWHFHDFMRAMHARLRALRSARARDPFARLARDLATEARVFALDDVRVDDIADAVAVLRLARGLVDGGTFLAMTSNIAPEDLYRDGLNAHRFASFAPFLRAHAEIVAAREGEDFRLRALRGRKLWFAPADAAARAQIDAIVRELADGAPVAPATLALGGGRTLAVAQACANVFARLDFAALFDAPLGFADYATLARAFRVVIVENAPELTPATRNATRRFTHFVEAAYERGVKLVVSAARVADELCRDAQETGFARVLSRLREMTASPDDFARAPD